MGTHATTNLRIAVLEDDPDQRRLIVRWLAEAEHHAVAFADAGELLRALRHDSFDLLLIDWILPRTSGLDVLRTVRRDIDRALPVIFVTVKRREEHVVEALSEGADDYIVKPARRRELLARIEAVTRRARGSHRSASELDESPFHFDRRHRQAWRDGTAVRLTQKEFELAWFLFSNPERPLSRAHLLERVWGRSASITTRTVDTHVSRLRSKLGLDGASGWRLTAIYQQGYRLERVPPEAPVARAARSSRRATGAVNTTH